MLASANGLPRTATVLGKLLQSSTHGPGQVRPASRQLHLIVAPREIRAQRMQDVCSRVVTNCPRSSLLRSQGALPSAIKDAVVLRRSFHAANVSRKPLTTAQSYTETAESKQPEKGQSQAGEAPRSRIQALVARLIERFRESQGAGKDKSAEESPPFPDVGKLWSLASTQKRTLIIALSLLLVSSAVSLTVPAAIGRIIDYFGNSDTSAFWGLSFGRVAGSLVVIFALGAAAKATSNILLELAGVRVIQAMRRQSFASALRQDVEWVDKAGGDVVSRLSVDTTIVGEALTSDVGDGLRAAVTVFAAGGAMMFISPAITGLMALIVPPAAISAVFFGKYIRTLTHKTQDAVGQMTNVANERLLGPAFRTIQAYNGQRRETKRLDKEIQKIAELQTREAKATGFYYSGTGFVGNCAILILLTYGGSLVNRGLLTIGDLTSLLMYTAYLGGGLMNLTHFFTSIMKGMGAGARVFSLIEREPKIRLGVGKEVPQALPTLEFRDVGFSYPSRPEMKILDGFNLKVEPGTSIAVCGPSGIGKTSVHALALRLYDPQSGRIMLNGVDIREYKPESLRSIFRVVGQDPVIFDGSIAENIAYSNEGAAQDEIEAAARAANCMDFIKALPLGLATNAKQLSLGQKQRITIARALCGSQRERILLMDESTSALDSASEYLVNKSIKEIVSQGQNTVWIIAHRLSTIRSVQKILVMEHGQIVEAGSFEELNRPGSRFRELMAAQLAPQRSASAPTPRVESANVSGTAARSYSTAATRGVPLATNFGETWSVQDLLQQSSGAQAPTNARLARAAKSAALPSPSAEEAKKIAQTLRLIEAVRQS